MTRGITMQAKRLANFELLRITAMLMVIALHYVAEAGIMLEPAETGESLWFGTVLGTAVESFCIVAVNVYVLTSGYFMVRSGFKVNRIVRLICQVYFYALLIPLVLAAAGIPILADREGLYGWIQYLLPVATGHYWFATEYVLLYLFSPFINAACEKMSKRQLGTVITLLLGVFCIVKSVVPIALATDSFGYDFGWFMCLYAVGSYIGLYGIPFLEKGKRGFWLYAGSSLGTFMLAVGIFFIHTETGWFSYYFEALFHYNFVLCFIGAVGLFYGFSKIRIREGKAADLIRLIGPLSFGVYLLQMHVDIRDRWMSWAGSLGSGIDKTSPAGLLIDMILMVLLVYVAGISVDYIRSRFFGLAEKLLAGRRGVYRSR